MAFLHKGYTCGTHRLVPPEETFARLAPLISSFGITRLADVTGLDRIGIPVYCAVRPSNRTLQVSNGKGLRHVDAKVSACMEAIELFHAENPNDCFERASFKSMRRQYGDVIFPQVLPGHRREAFFSRDFLIDWVKATDLLRKREVWLAASAAYLCTPSLYHWSSNGLASGNHLVEATLHGLYEVIERDAVSRLCTAKGQVVFSSNRCRFIDPRTLPSGQLGDLYRVLLAANIKMALIHVESCSPIHTFLAVLLDPQPFSNSSHVNIGYGTHLSSTVAAIRAITEAAQSRAIFIHGSREDLTPKAYGHSHDSLYQFFDGLETTADWRRLRDHSSDDLLDDYDCVLRCLSEIGYKNIFRVNMMRRPFNIPVVKVFVSGFKMNINLF